MNIDYIPYQRRPVEASGLIFLLRIDLINQYHLILIGWNRFVRPKLKTKENELLDIIKGTNDIIETPENSNPLIKYENEEQAKNLISKHLAKIFMATHKKKFQKEVEKLKALCK